MVFEYRAKWREDLMSLVYVPSLKSSYATIVAISNGVSNNSLDPTALSLPFINPAACDGS